MRDGLVRLLEVTGQGLREDPYDTHLLRNLQDSARELLHSADSLVKFLCFFLFELVDDVFFNVVGDVGYSKEADGLRRHFFCTTGSSLVQLALCVKTGNREECFKACEKLVLHCLELIEATNKASSQKQEPGD